MRTQYPVPRTSEVEARLLLGQDTITRALDSILSLQFNQDTKRHPEKDMLHWGAGRIGCVAKHLGTQDRCDPREYICCSLLEYILSLVSELSSNR